MNGNPKFFDDDRTEVNPDFFSKPQLCLSCTKNDDPNEEQDYISLTDMVRDKEGSDHIRNWMRNRNTVEFIGLWETLNNPGLFNCIAKDWRDANLGKAKKDLNIRDFASINELVVLENLENINSVLIRNQIDKPERFRQLREIVKVQLKPLDEKDFMRALKKVSDDIYIENKKNGILINIKLTL